MYEMTTSEIDIARKVEKKLLALKQSKMKTHHLLHAGIYTRTIKLHKGEMLSGALIKIPTTLTFSGHIKVYIGSKIVEVNGYDIIHASANRKQIMYAIKDTYVTMSFATKAQTVEDAEDEFTDEAHLLMSRTNNENNTIIITKEHICQEQ